MPFEDDLAARIAAVRAELATFLKDESIPKPIRKQVSNPSTLGPLRDGGATLRDALAELVEGGMRRRVGRSHLMCTREGDLVKHCFNDLLAEAKVHGALQTLTRDRLGRTAALRVALGSNVEGRSWASIAAEIARPAPLRRAGRQR